MVRGTVISLWFEISKHCFYGSFSPLDQNHFALRSTLFWTTDFSPQITTADPTKFGFFGQNNPQLDKESGQQTIREIFQNFPDPDAVVRQYIYGNLTDEQVRRQVYTSAGDAAILCPTVYYAEKCADMGGEVYYYVFGQRASDSPWAPWMGVVHGTEVEFVFGLPIMNAHNYFRKEVQLSSEVIGIWSSFAKYG